jgi:hypothetical protein
VNVLREILEFYYRKEGKGLQMGVSAGWNGGPICNKKEKRGQILF